MPQITIEQAFELALRHHEAGQLAKAENLYWQILAQQPKHAGVLHYLGVIAAQVGRTDSAVDLIGQAIALAPDIAEAHNSLGNVLRDRGQLEEAMGAYRRALALKPDYAEAYNNFGAALIDAGRLEEAAISCGQAIALKPDYPEAHSNLGNALAAMGQLDEAIAAHCRSIALRPQSPEAHVNLGETLRAVGRVEEAIAAHRQSIALKPGFPEALVNLGEALKLAGRLDEAIAAHCEAIALRPQFPEAHWNLALAMLLRGNFLPGWQEYEWRWKLKKFSSPLRDFPQPRWDGSDLNGRTLFLYSEQGFGDAIQFIRYLPMVAERDTKVIVGCPKELKRLLQGNSRGWQIAASGEPTPDFDVHYPLMSLPLLFGTTLQSVPPQSPSLRADTQAVRKWQGRLDTVSKGLKVGLAWAGNPAFKGDRLRSLRQLSLFSPLAQAVNVQFVSLQKGEAAKQTRNPPTGMELIDWTGELHDFADTAALIENLDLVISSDTAVAHLAGAMGKPVWVLLSFAPDWRWLLERDDSPWYPTMRLFRQTQSNGWQEVIRRVGQVLTGIIPTRG